MHYLPAAYQGNEVALCYKLGRKCENGAEKKL